MNDKNQSEFERIAAEERSSNLVGEFYEFLCHNKKWWLLPILAILLLVGVLLLAATTGIAPFIYPLF
jgi:hypothetical protein